MENWVRITQCKSGLGWDFRSFIQNCDFDVLTIKPPFIFSRLQSLKLPAAAFSSAWKILILHRNFSPSKALKVFLILESAIVETANKRFRLEWIKSLVIDLFLPCFLFWKFILFVLFASMIGHFLHTARGVCCLENNKSKSREAFCGFELHNPGCWVTLWANIFLSKLPQTKFNAAVVVGSLRL